MKQRSLIDVLLVSALLTLVGILFYHKVIKPHHHEPAFKYAGYECDDTTYRNGQILWPDMVHQDTLVVVNAELMNELITTVASDGEIMDMLDSTTVSYQTFSKHITDLANEGQ